MIDIGFYAKKNIFATYHELIFSIMKRKIIIPIVFVSMVFSVNSCGLLEDECKVCRRVVYEDGVFVSEDDEAEYCGVELIAIEGQQTTIGSQTLVWECD